MQRIGVGVLVAAAAVVAWITLGPAGEDGDAADAPSVSSAADPFDPIRRTPALVLGRIDREADPLAGGSDDPVADAGSSPEDSAPDPRSTGGGEYGMTGGGGQGPSRPTAEGRRPIDTADPASAPTNPLAPPAELPADAPSDGSDPGTAPVDPAELTDVEAQVAKLAEEQGLVDPSEADTWAKALPVALDAAKAANARLHLMTVVPEVAVPTLMQAGPYDYEAKLVPVAEAALDQFVREHVPGDVDTHRIVAYGSIYREILRVAAAIPADLIVMAAHRPQPGDFLIGSNAERVSRRARCTVTLVR